VQLYQDVAAPGRMALVCRFWIPEETARAREQSDGIPYSAWEREGWITFTQGDTIDLDLIEQAVKESYDEGGLEEAAFDDWNAAQICTHLQGHGVKMVKFGQNLRNFNEPSKRFEADLKEGKIAHGDNPVLAWMAANVSIYTDASGNIRPIKPKHASGKKIDGIVAAVMARGLAMVAPESGGGDIEFWD
jgi:phage terminase large subunit-like protein